MSDEPIVEFPSDYEAIEAANTAYRLACEQDPMLLSTKDRKRLERIRENALFIIDAALQYIREPYEKDDSDSD